MELQITTIVLLCTFSLIGATTAFYLLYNLALVAWDSHDKKRHHYLNQHIYELCDELEKVIDEYHPSITGKWAVNEVRRTLKTREIVWAGDLRDRLDDAKGFDRYNQETPSTPL